MKRQSRDGTAADTKRSAKLEGTGATSASVTKTKKRAKKDQAETKGRVANVVAETRQLETAGDKGSIFTAESGLGWENYSPWLGNVVDEQMSWGSTWLPIWDMDYLGEAFNASFNDVLWDDDIWNLRSISEIPHQCVLPEKGVIRMQIVVHWYNVFQSLEKGSRPIFRRDVKNF